MTDPLFKTFGKLVTKYIEICALWLKNNFAIDMLYIQLIIELDDQMTKKFFSSAHGEKVWRKK